MRPSTFNYDKQATALNFKVLKLIIPYLFEFKFRVGLAMLCLVIAKIANVTLPFLLKHLVDELSVQQAVVAVPVALVVVYGTVRFLNVIINEIRDTLFGRVTERAIRRIGLKVFNHLHTLDLNFHLGRKTGGISRDIERGTSGLSFLMRFMVFNIVPTLIEIVLVIGIFFYNYGWIYALVTLASVLGYIAFSVIATEWRTEYVREAAKADSLSNTRAIDSLINYETVKYFGNEEYEAKRYDDALNEWETAKRNNRLSLFTLNSGQAFIIAAAMTIMMVLAAYATSNKTMTIGDFVLINSFMLQLFIPLNFLGFIYREIRGALASIEQMFSLLDKKSEITDVDNAQDLVVSKGKIEFVNVSFSYKRREIFNNLSFTIDAGQKVAIVGESGAGKSTIIKLLFRFYDVTEGDILIDGKSIKEVSQKSLRQNIAMVPQDTVLFNTTLRDNIRYGRPDAAEEDIDDAIDMAYLRKFIDSLADKDATNVGERGLKLSGGEKQRVAIARAILKNAPIYVFDEATSSLDSNAEKEILKAFKNVSLDHTSLVVAHRLSTIIDADKIIVLQAGKLVEQGTHNELINKKGLYAELWINQQKTD